MKFDIKMSFLPPPERRDQVIYWAVFGVAVIVLAYFVAGHLTVVYEDAINEQILALDAGRKAPRHTAGDAGIEGWKTYRDEKYGFEVRYPNDWVNLSKDGTLEIVPKVALDAHPDYKSCDEDASLAMCCVCVFITTHAKIVAYSIEMIFSPNNLIGGGRRGDIRSERIISGVPAFETHIEPGENKYGAGRRFSIPKGNSTVILQIESAEMEKYNSIFDQLVSTFKFIEPRSTFPPATARARPRRR